jgi:sigma-B regulation protein RsbQ
MFRTVLFDHVGAGGSDLKAYDRDKYAALAGYANDVVEIGRELDLKDAVFVGHSVSCMIGALAVQKASGMFGKLVMTGPSARYIDDGDYFGGFSEKQIEELLQFLESNHMGWSAQMARRSWATRTGPNSARSSLTVFAGLIPKSQRRLRGSPSLPTTGRPC